MTHKYSVTEIDQMRASVQRLIRGGDVRIQEEHLRTYMLNGTDPQELEVAASEQEVGDRRELLTNRVKVVEYLLTKSKENESDELNGKLTKAKVALAEFEAAAERAA